MVNDPPIKVGDIIRVDGFVAKAVKITPTEGVLLDPVYTGKAMAGLIDLVKKGYFTKDDNVVFIHTGGTPALFPYGKELLEYLEKGNFAHYMDFFRRA